MPALTPSGRPPLQLRRVGVPGRDLASDPASSTCSAAPRGRASAPPGCVRGTGLLPAPPRDFSRLHEVRERVPWAGWGGRDPRERGDLSPRFLPAAGGGGNRPWVMMMI